MDVGDRGVDAERGQVGDARDDVAAPHQRAFLRHHPGQHAVAIRLCRRQVEEPSRLRRLLVERAALQREALELHAGGALGVVPLVTKLRQLDLRLLDRQLRPAQRLAREQPLFEQLLVAFELRLRRLELRGSSPRAGRRDRRSDFSSVSRVCACWFSLILRSFTTFSSASTDSLTSSSTTGSPCFKCAPGRSRSRSTRASSGLESTRSTSGTTVPDAMITASTGPAVTIAVRMRARVTDGRIHPGSHTITSAPIRIGMATFSDFRSRS